MFALIISLFVFSVKIFLGGLIFFAILRLFRKMGKVFNRRRSIRTARNKKRRRQVKWIKGVKTIIL